MSQKNESITEGIDILRNGGAILLDCIDGYIVCDATKSEAVTQLLKGSRNSIDSTHMVFVSSLTMLEGYIPDITESAYQIMELSESPTIIEFELNRNIAEEAKTAQGSVQTVFLNTGTVHQLINRFRKPLFAVKSRDLESHNTDLTIDIEELNIDSSKRIVFYSDHSFKMLRN